MNELIFLAEEAPEGGYTARALGQSIFTEADTLDQLRANIREAVQCHFEEDEMPSSVLLEMNVRQAVLYGLADGHTGRITPAAEVRARFGLPQ